MPGHRIRLDVSSSNHPRFDVNPNTGEPIGRDRRRVVADNTVFHERGRESRIVLPLIPIDRPPERRLGALMSPLEAHDPGLHDLIAPDAAIERIAGGLTFTEGPVWRGGALLFSDIPNKRIARWRRLPEGPELTTYATGMSNGLTLDRQGRVLAAEHDGRRVTRVADDGTRTVLAEQFQGKRLNSPNDIVVKSDGSIYFTDPPYARAAEHAGRAAARGLVDQAHPGQGAAVQWRVPPRPRRRRLHLVADDFALPNGLAFSPDESVLYIDDSAQKHIRAFDVRPDGTLDQWPRPARHGVGRPRRARRPQGGPRGQRVLHRARAASGCAARTARCWGASSCPSCPRTWRGARTAASSSSRRAPACTGCRRRRAGPWQAAEKGPSASLAPSAARSTYNEYASRAAVGRRLAAGPF